MSARAIARGVTDYFANEKPLPDVIDTPTNSSGDIGKHFAISEFVCHCCGRDSEKIDPRLIELLEQLRAKAGVPIHVNCGYRCPSHNAEVGGVPNSQHVLGTAADITIPQIGFDKAARGSFMLTCATAGKVIISNGGNKKFSPFRNWRGLFLSARCLQSD